MGIKEGTKLLIWLGIVAFSLPTMNALSTRLFVKLFTRF